MNKRTKVILGILISLLILGTAFLTYEVISGKAHYILQKPGQKSGEVEDIAYVEAKEGDKVVIPPGYGHITINPGKKTLIMSNLVESTFKSEYGSFKKLKGAAYYETTNGWEKNPNYTKVPEIRLIKVKKLYSKLPFFLEPPQYKMFIKNPEKFLFLTKPQEYTEFFKKFL